MMLLNPYVLAAVGGGGGGTDPLWADVLLLLHGDGSAGGTTITDSSAAARTATVSGVTTETSTAGYFGSAQLRIEGGEYLAWPGLRLTDFNTWTIEGFLTLADIGSPRSHLFGSWSPEQGWTLDVASGGSPFLTINGAGAPSTGSVTLATGTRTHLALVITTASGATTGTLYVNGVASQTYSGSACGWSAGVTSDLYQFRLGNRSDGTLNQNASWDEVRVTQGARYAADFTPPVAPYPDA